MSKERILITGGAGFIGSHVADVFIKKGHKVVIIDNLSRGTKKNVNKNAKFYQLDILSPRLKRIFHIEKPDILIHHAAQINVRDSIIDPKLDSRINILGSINLFKIAAKAGIKKIIYASSGGAVYGEPKYLPPDEAHPIDPLSPYGVSKYSAELYLKYFSKIFGFSYIILRYSNVYGPRQDPKGEAGVISIFINKLLNKESPIIFGDGKQTRDFINVLDVAKANYLAYKFNKNDVFNIGTGKETSVLEIYEKLKEILKINIKPQFAPALTGEVRRIYLDIKKAKRLLKFNPKISLKEGIKMTINWVKKNS